MMSKKIKKISQYKGETANVTHAESIDETRIPATNVENAQIYADKGRESLADQIEYNENLRREAIDTKRIKYDEEIEMLRNTGDKLTTAQTQAQLEMIRQGVVTTPIPHDEMQRVLREQAQIGRHESVTTVQSLLDSSQTDNTTQRNHNGRWQWIIDKAK